MSLVADLNHGKQHGWHRWLLGGLLASLILLLLPLSVDNLKFLILAVSLIGYWSYRLIWVKEEAVTIPTQSFSLLLFVLLSFISVYWASDHSMGLKDSFIWLISILLAISIGDLVRIKADIARHISKLLAITFLIFLVFHLGAIQLDIGLHQEWNALMSKNKNYTTTLLTCLSPYLIFYPSRSQFVRFLKVISIVLLINLLFITGTRGAMLAFLLIVVLKIWNFYAHKPFRYLLTLVGGLVIVAAIYFLNVSESSMDFTFVKEYRKDLDSRIMMNKNSIAAIKDHPMGVGAGNWTNVIYSYGVDDIPSFNSPNEFVRYRSHNLYFKTASETGLLGLTLLLVSIMGTLIYYRSGWSELSGYTKAAWTSVLGWIVVSYFYATAISYEYFFSGVVMAAMISLGILLSGLKSSRQIKIPALSLLFFLSMVCLFWFTYMKYTHDNYAKATRHISNNESQEAIKILERIYHPIWNTSHDYYTSIGHVIAEQAHKLGALDKAEDYYTKSIVVAPDHPPLLSSYASFLLKEKKRPDLALPYIKQILIKQPTHQATLEMLQEIERTLKD